MIRLKLRIMPRRHPLAGLGLATLVACTVLHQRLST